MIRLTIKDLPDKLSSTIIWDFVLAGNGIIFTYDKLQSLIEEIEEEDEDVKQLIEYYQLLLKKMEKENTNEVLLQLPFEISEWEAIY